MTNEMLPVFGEEHANAFLKAGWSQCQIFRRTADLPHSGENVLFVVCTQSCTVVSPDLSRDPFVEIAEGRPLNCLRQGALNTSSTSRQTKSGAEANRNRSTTHYGRVNRSVHLPVRAFRYALQ
jgi:hypothetical protein